MRWEAARREAADIAYAEGVRMALTYAEFGEEPDPEDRFGYCPAAAAAIFSHDTVVERIDPARGRDVATCERCVEAYRLHRGNGMSPPTAAAQTGLEACGRCRP